MARCTSTSLLTSQRENQTFSWAAANWMPASSFRSSMMRFAPWSAKRWTHAAPNPELPPVTEKFSLYFHGCHTPLVVLWHCCCLFFLPVRFSTQAEDDSIDRTQVDGRKDKMAKGVIGVVCSVEADRRALRPYFQFGSCCPMLDFRPNLVSGHDLSRVSILFGSIVGAPLIASSVNSI